MGEKEMRSGRWLSGARAIIAEQPSLPAEMRKAAERERAATHTLLSYADFYCRARATFAFQLAALSLGRSWSGAASPPAANDQKGFRRPAEIAARIASKWAPRTNTENLIFLHSGSSAIYTKFVWIATKGDFKSE